MGFFPDVSPGDAFQPSAVLENNLRHIVNAWNGFGAGALTGKGGGPVKIQVYNSTGATINAGTGVNFDESKQLVGDALPAKPCSDASKPWGVVPATLKANEMGDCIVSGPARVTLSGGSGAYAQPGSGGTTFTRGESGALVLYANSSSNNGVILLGGGSGGGIAPEYNGFFKLVLEASQNESESKKSDYFVRIVDGGTYNPEKNPVSENSLCYVNAMSFSVPPYKSDKITQNESFYLKYTAAKKGTETEEASPASVVITTASEEGFSYAPDNDQKNCWYFLGRAEVDKNGGVRVEQYHGYSYINGISGNSVAQIWWYGICFNDEEEE